MTGPVERLRGEHEAIDTGVIDRGIARADVVDLVDRLPLLKVPKHRALRVAPEQC